MKISNCWVNVLGLLALMLMAQSVWAATCTSTGNADWKSGSWFGTGCTGGNGPPAGATVVIANGTQIKVDTNPAAVVDITVNAGGTLVVQSTNTLTFTGNLTVNGTFTAQANSTVSLTGTNQTITGNVTFANLTVAVGTQLTLVGNIVITGTTNLTAANIVSTCPTNYTVTNQTTGAVVNSCTNGGGGGGGGTCTPLLPALPAAGIPIASGATITVGAGTNVNGTAVTLAANQNTVLSAATATAWNSGSGALANPPSPIPASTVQTVVSNNATLAAGSYGDVRVTAGTGVFTGGSYYINQLYVAPGATAQLAPGDYYVNKLTVGSSITRTGGTITISPQGLVRIFVMNNVRNDTALYGGASGIWDASNINVGGTPGNLQVLMYPTGYLRIGDNAKFTGFVVQPTYGGAAGTRAIDVRNGVALTGGVYSAGVVRIRNNVVFTYNAQVTAGITALTQCASSVDHFLISHPGTGLTCSTQAVTVSACANAACTTFVGGISVTLQPGGAVVTTTSAGANATTVAQTTAGAATLTATSATATASATQCANTTTGAAASAAACKNAMTFNTAGFVITAPNHVSCADTVVTIEAMQANTANRCVPAYANVTRAVNLSITYTDPTTGAKTLTDVTNTSAITTAASAHNLTFDATGKATLSVSYPDVGQVTLTASDTAPTGTAMTGSGSFIAAPAAFAISGVTAGPIKAGNNFAATVTAQTGTGTACAVAATAPNFGKETVAEGVTLSFTKCQPTGVNSSNGAFSGSVGAFAGGVASAANLSWSEVGNGDLVATLTSGSYLGSALTATGNTGTGGTACTGAGNVGAFIPDHFTTSIINGCLGCGFTYSGQPFTVSVTAMNGLATPTTTLNYDGTANTTPNFANNVTLTDANALATPVGKLGVSAAVTGVTANAAGTTLTVPKADFTQGVATLTSVPTYTFNVATTAPTTIKMHAVDAVNTTVTSAAVEGATEIRSGRIKVSNANGSEQLPLTLTAAAQYYSGAAWLTSTTDSATSFNTNLSTATGNIVQSIIKGPLTGITVSGPGVTTVTNGVAAFKLNKPGVSGVVDISVNAPSYLATSGVAGRATFGVYKGTKEFIYLREAY